MEQHIRCCRYNPNGICIDCGFINGVVEQHNCLQNLKNFIISEVRKNEESSQKISSLECELMKVNENSKLLENKVQSLTKEMDSLSQSQNDLKSDNNQLKIIIKANEVSLSLNVKIINEYIETNKKLLQQLEINSIESKQKDNIIENKIIKIFSIRKYSKRNKSKVH